MLVTVDMQAWRYEVQKALLSTAWMHNGSLFIQCSGTKNGSANMPGKIGISVTQC